MNNNEVIFLNPPWYIKKILKINKLNFESYPKDKNPLENKIKIKSPIFKLYKLKYNNITNKKIIQILNSEYTQSKKFLLNNKFDEILFWNGLMDVESISSKELKIKTYYFENGYFPNTLQMSINGTNAFSELYDLTYEQFMKFNYKSKEINTPEFSIIKPKLFYPIKLFIESLFIPRKFENIFTKTKLILSPKITKIRKKNKKKTTNIKIKKPHILFPLQVNSDTQIKIHSKYKSMYEILDLIIPEIKKTNYSLIIREHPEEVSYSDYSKYIDNEQIFIDNSTDLSEQIKKSKLVLIVNSSVGLQALSLKKPVCIFGNAIYQNSPISIRYDDYKNIKKIISKAENILDEENNKKIENYVKHFKKNIFINGNWRKPEKDLIIEVCKRIQN
ncbi:MAG: hypothetical protein ACOCXG_00830 [Nanoarchaeota archaeon]